MSQTFLLLLLFSPASTFSMRVLSTRREVIADNPLHSGAEVLNSSLARQDTVTICARFNIYRFTNTDHWDLSQPLITLGDGIGDGGWFLYFSLMTEEHTFYKDRSGPLWRNGDVLLLEFGNPLLVDWKPRKWNSLCVALSISKKLNKIWFNGKLIRNDRSYHGIIQHSDNNIRIMGKYYPKEDLYKYSMFGAMTDINIWNRSLTESEVELWTKCKLGSGGNLLDWSTAQWKKVRLEEMDIDEQEVCKGKTETKNLYIFQNKKTLEEGRKFCESMGGEVEIARDSRLMQEMAAAVKVSQGNCGHRIYAGYTDKYEDGVWLDTFNETGNLSWIKWNEGEPNNYGGNEDCIELDVKTSPRCNDVRCSQKYCPLCRLPHQTVFHLQGICQESFLDRYYMMQSAGSWQMLGYRQDSLDWVEEKRQWQISNMDSKIIMAFLNETSDFPLGTHHWYFIDGSNCSDSDQDWRSLNLHLKVEQPGNVCCGDGICIDSDWKCDGDKGGSCMTSDNIGISFTPKPPN